MENQNIRIHLKAYDNKILDLSTEEIVNTANRTAPDDAGSLNDDVSTCFSGGDGEAGKA